MNGIFSFVSEVTSSAFFNFTLYAKGQGCGGFVDVFTYNMLISKIAQNAEYIMLRGSSVYKAI